MKILLVVVHTELVVVASYLDLYCYTSAVAVADVVVVDSEEHNRVAVVVVA